MEIGNQVPPVNNEWLWPGFEDLRDKIINHLDLDRSTKSLGEDPARYRLEEGFVEQDRYWIGDINTSRMTADSTVLYRPGILNQLIQKLESLLNSKMKEGMLIKGPQGVGKSYTLVNLTRYLLASKEYVVTIIPDCYHWDTMGYFLQYLLSSVGLKLHDLGLKHRSIDGDDLNRLIHDIDIVLQERGRKWVFSFDQINRIFARQQFSTTKDVGALPYPFKIMANVRKAGRIISILSASANNDVSHRDNHQGFKCFDHPIQFEKREMEILYTEDKVASWSMPELQYATGGIPLYINEWVSKGDLYPGRIRSDIMYSLQKLQSEQSDNWKRFIASSIQCLLGTSLPNTPINYDRKYSEVQENNNAYTIVALFPLVEEAYREFFWEDLKKHIGEHETKLLDVCAHERTTDDVRGRLFEQMVIARLCNNGLSADDISKILNEAKVTMTSDMRAALQCGVIQDLFEGMAYPRFAASDCFTLYVPLAPNFPAIDLFFRLGHAVIAFQIHVAEKHADVLTSLQSHVKNAKWKSGGIHTISLVYLVPVARQGKKAKKTRSLKRKREQPPQTSTDYIQCDDYTYVTMHKSLQDFEPLQTMKWRV